MHSLEQAVMAAILHLREGAYGVPIREEVMRRTGKRTSIGAIYTTLARLQDKGFVSSWYGEATAERGGRRKRYYKVEAAGVKALQDTRDMVVSFISPALDAAGA